MNPVEGFARDYLDKIYRGDVVWERPPERIAVGDVWRTRVGQHPVHIVDSLCLRWTGFPFLGRIEFGAGSTKFWAFSEDGRSSDLADTGFDLVERIFPVEATA